MWLDLLCAWASSSDSSTASSTGISPQLHTVLVMTRTHSKQTVLLL
jgi:hypothetical protein